MSRLVIQYDKLLEKIPYKYAIPIVVAKRAEAINDFAKPFVTTPDNYSVSIAFKELQEGYIRIKNEDVLKILLPDVK
ncbi:DNA-directed RNA polymerase subunit omega [Fervidobacterium pennivorans subsp. shakshaketiis]|uniref:DNA-directed RNA polymerase subunit omega n=1 Tax=Fervidobacterium pennivorans (strain DSM 9078 / Ven5) TaxID=771875 RepID=H9UER9_FERPD|nr:DNA-directed RNA polymerase subunit omega [Fervidobacterium pennivorans]AFG36012.1 DNA-directed RNA polymerase, subunit K/omega [Fervidobacterium pennivorans DSM 9078]QIV79067.1 DNA-directed RNA polymerase subunit omega [Fervidobacterium pennivorans subsp. keratinolyticus]